MIKIIDQYIRMTFFTVAIDFDGCITVDREAEGSNMIIQDGCIETIKMLYSMGHKLILNTCRVEKQLEEALEWMEEHNIKKYFSLINENDPYEISCYGSDCRKIHADIYIDDRNLGGFLGWVFIKDYFLKKRKDDYYV